jgi:hypothetical protein
MGQAPAGRSQEHYCERDQLEICIHLDGDTDVARQILPVDAPVDGGRQQLAPALGADRLSVVALAVGQLRLDCGRNLGLRVAVVCGLDRAVVRRRQASHGLESKKSLIRLAVASRV